MLSDFSLIFQSIQGAHNWGITAWQGHLVKIEQVKDALSGLRRSLAPESPLEMIKNTFYFTSKALFVLKIFKFLS